MKEWIKWVGVMSGRHARWGSLESGNNGRAWVDVGAGSEHNGARGLERWAMDDGIGEKNEWRYAEYKG